MITQNAMNSNWNELPIWAALMIINTAKGLTPAHNPDFEWEWGIVPFHGELPVIIVHKGGFRYIVRQGAPWVV